MMEIRKHHTRFGLIILSKPQTNFRKASFAILFVPQPLCLLIINKFDIIYIYLSLQVLNKIKLLLGLIKYSHLTKTV